ncbi:MAG: RimK family alpha-L-glutamate ligase, partial [Candidatus Omnitrophica bacterium]|nr:RimK family alpha-L-glutamate ligase [Candidatus Omnitrophota bacterium]
MKIAILSRGKRLYSTKRLREACVARGHDVNVLDTLDFSINVEQGKPGLIYKNKNITDFDAVIPRIGSSITFFGAAVLRQFEEMGMFCLNSSLGIITSRDKLRSIQLLARHNIGFPQTIFVKQKKTILPAIEKIGGAPVVIKLLEGTQGIGVILADTNKVAEAIIETLHSTKQNVLIQKFIKESKGRDVRAIVVGNKVVAAMRRVAQGDEFRSNVHRGGKVENVELDERFERTAIRAAQIMGLNV